MLTIGGLLWSSPGLAANLGSVGAGSGEGGASVPTEGRPTAPAVTIDPSVFQSLEPDQQNLVQQRLQGGSSQTRVGKPPDAGRDPGEAGRGHPEAKVQVVAPPTEFEALAGVKQFGYSYFERAEQVAPLDDLPVPDDYRVGAGDELIVSALGPRRSSDVSLIVNRDGTINYPNVGLLPVAGQTFAQLTRLLERRLKGDATNLQLSVRMGKLRTIQVALVGQVVSPGTHYVSSLTMLSGALAACGGPTRNGSLRNLQLRRRGKLVASFDLYDFLLRGENQINQRLESGDVIVVPPVGPMVALSGSVKRPGIYELKGPMKLGAVLQLAGGLAPGAMRRQVQIERLVPHRARTLMDLDLEAQPRLIDTPVQDGDIVRSLAVPAKVVNALTLEGHVNRPGSYAFRSGMRVRDLLGSEAELKPEAYLDFALIERVMPPDAHVELLPLKLGRLFAGDAAENRQLQAGDTLRVFYRWDIQKRPMVKIVGAVNRPGEFPLRPHMRLRELLYLAGGILPEADVSQAELTRVQIVNNQVTTNRLDVQLDLLLRGDGSGDLELERDDYLLVKTVPNYRLYRTVSLQGEVNQPGVYTFRDGESLAEVVRRAGGFTGRAYLKGAVFTRASVQKQQQDRLQDLVRKLQSDILHGTNQAVGGALSSEALQSNRELLDAKKQMLADLAATKASGRMIVSLAGAAPGGELPLEEGDVLIVPPVLNVVSVLGQVMTPTAVTYERGLTVGEVIRRVGGTTEHADNQGMFVVRADGSVMSEKTYGWGFGFMRWGLDRMALEAGDTIMVPERMAVDTSLRDIRDITQVLYQIATAAAVTWGIVK